jgi:predicted Co/Zn/Cd cation transporter (cation efflux family)
MSTPEAIETQKREARRRELRSDLLYVAGALLVVCGIALRSFSIAIIFAGIFSLLMPMLELASGFIRGLRRPRARNS